MATIDVKNAEGSTESIEKPLPPGRAGEEESRPVALSEEDKAVLDGCLSALEVLSAATPATPKFASITASTSGNNTLVAAVTSKKIRILALWLTASDAVNAKFQSGAGGTDLTGLAYEVANSGIVLPFNPVGWFETASNTLLNLNLSAAVAVGGSLVYVEV